MKYKASRKETVITWMAAVVFTVGFIGGLVYVAAYATLPFGL